MGPPSPGMRIEQFSLLFFPYSGMFLTSQDLAGVPPRGSRVFSLKIVHRPSFELQDLYLQSPLPDHKAFTLNANRSFWTTRVSAITITCYQVLSYVSRSSPDMETHNGLFPAPEDPTWPSIIVTASPILRGLDDQIPLTIIHILFVPRLAHLPSPPSKNNSPQLWNYYCFERVGL